MEMMIFLSLSDKSGVNKSCSYIIITKLRNNVWTAREVTVDSRLKSKSVAQLYKFDVNGLFMRINAFDNRV